MENNRILKTGISALFMLGVPAVPFAVTFEKAAAAKHSNEVVEVLDRLGAPDAAIQYELAYGNEMRSDVYWWALGTAATCAIGIPLSHIINRRIQ